MREIIAAALAAASGAAAMYYLDPTTGRRRRALARDRAVGLSHDAGHYALAQGRRAADHLKGEAARSRSALRHSLPTSDGKLHGRVRAHLGHLVSHPKAIEVDVDQGWVCLRGRVLANEARPLLDEISSLPGVKHVDNQLTVHDEPGDLKELQRRIEPVRRYAARPLMALLVVVPLVVLALAAAAQAARHSRRRFLHWPPARRALWRWRAS
jgi:BON domain-containing protein